jgi:hypothetical protein
MLRYPLTDLVVPEGSAIPTVPVAIKVHDAGAAGPSGAAGADVVYETADSGAGTQLACLYQSAFPAKVGPVGSAGMPDLWVVPQYRAMLFSAGATSSVTASMAKWPGYSNASIDAGPPFDAAYSKRGAYVLAPAAAQLAAEFSATITSSTPVGLKFSASSGSTATPISAVSIPFSASRTVSWRFDEGSGRYLRSVGGKKWLDAQTKQRISARNVVVLWARYSALDKDISGGGGYDVTLGGSGQASVFRDGQRLDGKWRADGTSPPRFTAESGSSIRLAPGSTWFEVIPLSTNITLR